MMGELIADGPINGLRGEEVPQQARANAVKLSVAKAGHTKATHTNWCRSRRRDGGIPLYEVLDIV
jgi:hypothetical protein